MSLVNSGRVFIFGAGASAFAGFPLGPTLWPFMIDHCGIRTGAMEAIDAYFSRLPIEEREKASGDLEKLLTRFQNGDVPLPFDEMGKPPKPEALAAWDTTEERDAFFEMHGHLDMNPKKLDRDAFYRARLICRGSVAAGWYPISMPTFVSSLAAALLNHHACIRYGKAHHFAGRDPPPEDFTDALRGRCPCYPKFNLSKGKPILAAIARMFRRGDTVITFNYDALLESILWQAGKWSFVDGYGIDVEIHEERLGKLRRRLPKIQRPSSIKILKAHGSVNWVKDHEGKIGVNYLGLLFDLPLYSTYLPDREKNWSPEVQLGMVEDGIYDHPDSPYTEQIQMSPTYKKAYSEEPYKTIWGQIGRALETACEITVCGYRLPDGDSNAGSFITNALRENKRCTKVTVVNGENRSDSSWPNVLSDSGKQLDAVPKYFQDWVPQGR